MKRFVVLSCFLMVMGCAHTARHKSDYVNIVRTAVEDINLSDGIDEKEAVTWGQYLMIRQGVHEGLSSLDPLKVEKKTFWVKDDQVLDVAPINLTTGQIYDQAGFEKKESWTVYFLKQVEISKHPRYRPFYVEFDAQTGELFYLGFKNN